MSWRLAYLKFCETMVKLDKKFYNNFLFWLSFLFTLFLLWIWPVDYIFHASYRSSDSGFFDCTLRASQEHIWNWLCRVWDPRELTMETDDWCQWRKFIGDEDYVFCKISYKRLWKKFERSLWNTLGLGGNWFMKKPEAKNLVTLSL